MIVVCGDLAPRPARQVSVVRLAARAVGDGVAVQAVGVVSDDAEGDRRIHELVAAGVGHAAVLRGPVRPLDAADVDLALRYLADVRVVVTVGLAEAAVASAAERATWGGATLIVVNSPGSTGNGTEVAAVPEDAIVLEAPASDPDGTFAGFVGSLAARLDGGATPADAWAATTRELAVDPV